MSLQRGGNKSCLAGKLIFQASLRQEEELRLQPLSASLIFQSSNLQEVGRLERWREAADEVRLREEARPEWSGEVDRSNDK